MVIVSGSPEMNSTRHVVHRALPPQACRMSTPAFCSTASTRRFPFGTSKVPYPSTVSFGITRLYRGCEALLAQQLNHDLARARPCAKNHRGAVDFAARYSVLSTL